MTSVILVLTVRSVVRADFSAKQDESQSVRLGRRIAGYERDIYTGSVVLSSTRLSSYSHDQSDEQHATWAVIRTCRW